MRNVVELFENLYFTYDFVVKIDSKRANTIPDSEYIIARDKDKNNILLVRAFNVWTPEERDRIKNDPQVEMILGMVLTTLMKAETGTAKRPFERANQGGTNESEAK